MMQEDSSIQLTEDHDLEVGKSFGPEFNYARAIVAANKVAGDLVGRKKFVAAKISLLRAITASQENHELWSNLSSVLWSLRSYEDACVAAQTSLSLNHSGEPEARAQGVLALGNTYVSLGKYDLALQCFDELISYLPDNKEARWNRTLLYLLQGNYLEGWPDYYLRIDKDKKEGEKDHQKHDTPLWKGESLEGKFIRVLHDQGYGDTIMYSRFLDHILAMKPHSVYFSTAPELVPLLWNFSEKGIIFTHNGAPIPDADYHVYLGTIPSILGITRDTVPPPSPLILDRASQDLKVKESIHIDPPKVPYSLKIGICWSGRTDFDRNDERSVPLRLLASIAESPQMWLYSLQFGDPAKDIYDLGCEQFIKDHSDQIASKGWIGTATAILQMDVVVTCCTSIAHLAGSLGVPTWVLLHTEPYWPWGHEGEDTPWYPSVRLFRQQHERRGDWTVVVEKVRTELYNLLKQKIEIEIEQLGLTSQDIK